MERTEEVLGARPRKYVMKKPRNGHIYGEVGQHFFLRGKHQGLIFFIRNNKQCVRTQGDMTTERWWKDEKFANTRGAAREFGAACAYSGAIRKGLGQMAKEVGGTKALHNKVVKRVLHSFKGLPGRRGERVLSGEHVASRLQRLAWAKDGKTHLMPYGFSKAVIEPMIWKPKVEFQFVPGFSGPSWASQVRVVFRVVAVGDMVKRKNGKKYTVARGHREWHGVSKEVCSEWKDISLSTGLSTSTELERDFAVRPDLLFGEAVELGMGLVVMTAVEVRGFQPNGEVFDQQFVGMECVWAGGSTAPTNRGSAALTNHGSTALTNRGSASLTNRGSVAEKRHGSLRQAQDGAAVLTNRGSAALPSTGSGQCTIMGEQSTRALEVVEWLRQQEPLILECAVDAPPEMHERVARDRLRRLEAIRMIEEALSSG